MGVPGAQYLKPQWVLLIFLTLAILVHQKRYFIAAFICIFLMIKDVEHLLVYLFPIVYLLWGSVCSNVLPIF